MEICFEGIGQVVATFRTEDEKLTAGVAVTLKESGVVQSGAENEAPCGVTVGAVRGGAVAVQIGGVVKVGCSDSTPEVGWQKLVCDGKGGVKAVSGTDGVKYLVLAVDEAKDEKEDKSKKSVVVKL